MTVGIAAFADGGNAIILAADKLATLGVIEVESPNTQKRFPLGTTGWHALFAGTAAQAAAIVRAAAQKLSGNSEVACDQVSRCVEEAYQEVRDKAFEAQVLRPLSLTNELFARRSSKLLPLPDSIVEDIRDATDDFDFENHLLVCGFDSEGPHIVSAIPPTPQSAAIVGVQDILGRWAIGAGSGVALPRLAWLAIDSNMPVDRVLYEVYDALASASVATTVGKRWDAWILRRGKTGTDLLEVPQRDGTHLIEEVF